MVGKNSGLWKTNGNEGVVCSEGEKLKIPLLLTGLATDSGRRCCWRGLAPRRALCAGEVMSDSSSTIERDIPDAFRQALEAEEHAE